MKRYTQNVIDQVSQQWRRASNLLLAALLLASSLNGVLPALSHSAYAADDTTPPTITDFTYALGGSGTPYPVKDGIELPKNAGRIFFSAKVSDDLSGVDTSSVVAYVDGDGGTTSYPTSLAKNGDLYFGSIDISGIANTTNSAVSISATDNAGNIAYALGDNSFTASIVDALPAPAITSNGGGSTASIDVAAGDTSVTTVTDSHTYGDTVTYSLSGGADESLFTIDPYSGQLSFKSAPSYVNPTDSDSDNNYEVTVRATGSGGHDDQAITVSVTDTTGPTIHGFDLQDGDKVSGVLDFRFHAHDPSGVSQIELDVYNSHGDSVYQAVGYSLDDTQTSYAYELITDTAIWADGTYTFEVRADDSTSNSNSTSVTATVTIDNTSPAPSLTLVTPTNDADIGGSDDFAIKIADNGADISDVEYTLTNPDWGATSGSGTMSYDSTSGDYIGHPSGVLGDGSYHVVFTVTYNHGGIVTKAADFTIGQPSQPTNPTNPDQSGTGTPGKSGNKADSTTSAGSTGNTTSTGTQTQSTQSSAAPTSSTSTTPQSADESTSSTPDQKTSTNPDSVKKSEASHDKNSGAWLGLGWWWLVVVAIVAVLGWLIARRRDA